jgi:hypothetical protein
MWLQWAVSSAWLGVVAASSPRVTPILLALDIAAAASHQAVAWKTSQAGQALFSKGHLCTTWS